MAVNFTDRIRNFVPGNLVPGASRKHTDRLPPMLAGGLPVAGHIVPFTRDPVDLIWEGKRKHGNVFSLRLAGNRIHVMLGPDASEAVLRARDDVMNPKEAYKLMTPIFGEGIAYDAEPDVMAEQLGFLHPALKKSRMMAHAAKMNDEVERYVENWGDEGEIDLLDMTNELTMYVSSRCVLGIEFREQLSREFKDLYLDLERGLTPIAYFFPNLPLPRFRRRDQAREKLVEMIGGIVESRRRRGFVGEDALQALMDARYKDGRPLTDHEITGLLLTIVFAGHHTSGVMSAWTGIELLRHPQHIPAILQEQQEVYGDGRPVSFESLKELKHLERVLQESERLHPPIVLLLRKAMVDFSFGDYVIPAGEMVMLSPAVSNRSEDAFTNPHVFDPDRFGPGREEHKQHPFSLTSFGGGLHVCMGLHFAYMQIKALWSVLLRRFEFELQNPSYEPSYDFMVVGPERPCRLRYRRRKQPLVEVPRTATDLQ